MTTADVTRAALAMVEAVPAVTIPAGRRSKPLYALIDAAKRECKRSQHRPKRPLCSTCALRMLLEAVRSESHWRRALKRRAEWAESVLCGIYFDAGRGP